MSRLPDLEALAIFTRVVDAGSFARAAESAGLSQPTVSKAISRLERRLGLALLHRTSRGLSVTAAGEAALKHARAVLEEGMAAENAVVAQTSVPSGVVRMLAPASFGTHCLAPRISAFLDRHPRVEVELSFCDQPGDSLSCRFDLAVRLGDLADSALRTRRVGTMPYRLVASPAYLARHHRPEHPRDLTRHQCLIDTAVGPSDIWTFRDRSGADHPTPITGRLRSNSVEALLPACLAGDGIALLPEYLAADLLAAGRLAELLPDWRPDGLPINLVMPSSRLQPACASALTEFLTETFVAGGWKQRGAIDAAPPPSASQWAWAGFGRADLGRSGELPNSPP